MMERGKSGFSQTRMEGQVFWFLFNDWKRDSPGWAKPETSPELGNQLDSNPLATLNADSANSFAIGNAPRAGFHPTSIAPHPPSVST
jgi:hypothetical protein